MAAVRTSPTPAKIIVCPPVVDGGFSGTIEFPPDGGFSLDGGVGTSGDGVTVDPLGRITLNSQDIEINYAWIANWKMGTVSKFDTKNPLPDGGIHEVGRYVSVFPLDGLGRRNHTSSASVYDPSRTAIDINGDMWVANFASHAGQFFNVTKVAGSPFNCVDRNGNGKIDTSFDDPTDVANYGIITPSEYLNPSDPNNPLLYDECVLFTQELGNINPNGAFGEGSISIAAAPEGGPGDVWVGTWIDRRMWRLDPFTGIPKAIPPGTNVGQLPDGGGMYIGVPSIEPYGSAVDSKNRLWVVHRTQNTVAVIDTNTGSLLANAIVAPAGFPRGGYGIAVDKQGRVWVPNWGSGPTATRYTPPTDGGPIDAGTWDLFNFAALTSPSGTKVGQGRGVTVDDDGFVWFSGDRNNLGSAALVWGASIDDGGVRVFDGGTPTGLVDATSTWSKTSIGIGLDQNKNLWVNNSTGQRDAHRPEHRRRHHLGEPGRRALHLLRLHRVPAAAHHPEPGQLQPDRLRLLALRRVGHGDLERHHPAQHLGGRVRPRLQQPRLHRVPGVRAVHRQLGRQPPACPGARAAVQVSPGEVPPHQQGRDEPAVPPRLQRQLEVPDAAAVS